MILAADFATWAHTAAPTGLGLDTTIPVLRIDQADADGGVVGQAVFVAGTGGPGYILDSAADVATIQLRCRGAQGNLGDAYDLGEAFASSVDDLMYAATANGPTTIGGRHVINITRLGGQPAYLLTRNRQADFTASYSIQFAAS